MCSPTRSVVAIAPAPPGGVLLEHDAAPSAPEPPPTTGGRPSPGPSAPWTAGVPVLSPAGVRGRGRLPGPAPVPGALRPAHGAPSGLAVVRAARRTPGPDGPGLGGARKGNAPRGARASARRRAAGRVRHDVSFDERQRGSQSRGHRLLAGWRRVRGRHGDEPLLKSVGEHRSE